MLLIKSHNRTTLHKERKKSNNLFTRHDLRLSIFLQTRPRTHLAAKQPPKTITITITSANLPTYLITATNRDESQTQTAPTIHAELKPCQVSAKVSHPPTSTITSSTITIAVPNPPTLLSPSPPSPQHPNRHRYRQPLARQTPPPPSPTHPQRSKIQKLSILRNRKIQPTLFPVVGIKYQPT